MNSSSNSYSKSVGRVGEGKRSRKGRNYDRIPYETRIELITKVVFHKEKLRSTAERLGVKLSTAKFIVKCFKKYGRVFKKHGSYFQLTEEQQRLIMAYANQTTQEKEQPKVSIVCPVVCYVPYVQPYTYINQLQFPNFMDL